MIRQMNDNDTETVLEIWVNASNQSHDFMPARFWELQKYTMRTKYLPAAKTWVWVNPDEGCVQGFLSMHECSLAALFVHPQVQANGIGSALLEHAKNQYSRLSLTVYACNEKAIRFYHRHGFEITAEQIDPATSHPEYVMEFSKSL